MSCPNCEKLEQKVRDWHEKADHYHMASDRSDVKIAALKKILKHALSALERHCIWTEFELIEELRESLK